ncbi:MAG: FkbM family methyltransferase [Solirubrobacteraceae bacterium]
MTRDALAQRLTKPHYLYRPGRAVRRLLAIGRQVTKTTLVWGDPIHFDPDTVVGDSIRRTGVYDLVVCEALFRLAERGGVHVDAGANIGVMTSVLARCAGPEGLVIAVEPNPASLELLHANVSHWRRHAPIDVAEAALSDEEGMATLYSWPWSDGTGTASLSPHGSPIGLVQSVRLDDIVAGRSVGVLKLDVDEHELHALRGAERLLATGRIRDVVFEQLEPLPTPVSALLLASGYSIFGLDLNLRGLRLYPAGELGRARRSWDPPSYLATLEPVRAEALLRPRGWRAFRRD